MGAQSDKWRAEAAEQKPILAELITDDEVSVKTVSAVSAAILTRILPAFADLLDILEQQAPMNTRFDKLRAVVQRSHDLRAAAAAGDWDKFDTLAFADVNGSTDNGNAEGSGTGTT